MTRVESRKPKAGRRDRKSFRLLPLALALAGGVACDIPTDAPHLEQTWIVPVRELVIAVKELLPASADTANGAIVVTPDPVVVGTTLGALCGAPCNSANGTTVPKPAFTGSITASIALPDSVTEFTLNAPGVADIILTNDLGFDPLRPAAAVTGRLITTVRSGGVVVGADTVTGTTAALPNGGTLTHRVTVPAGTVILAPVTATSVIESPAGDPVLINTAATLSVNVQTNDVEAARLNILIQAKRVATQVAQLDLSSIGQAIKDHIITAALQLEINNPLPIQGTLQARFQAAGSDVITPRTFAVAPGISTLTLVFTRDEFLALTDLPDVNVAADGDVSGTGTPVTVTPATRISARLRFGVRVRLGGPIE